MFKLKTMTFKKKTGVCTRFSASDVQRGSASGTSNARWDLTQHARAVSAARTQPAWALRSSGEVSTTRGDSHRLSFAVVRALSHVPFYLASHDFPVKTLRQELLSPTA